MSDGLKPYEFQGFHVDFCFFSEIFQQSTVQIVDHIPL